MSIEAIAWVFRQDIRPSYSKFVLLAMADNANVDGECWPCIESISYKTSQDRKTVISSLKRLEASGFIKDTGRRVGITGQVKVYVLNGFSIKGIHYVYRLTNDETGQFYFGCRSSIGEIEEDKYMGSGKWPLLMQKSGIVLSKEILGSFVTRQEADALEMKLIRDNENNKLCMNIGKRTTGGTVKESRPRMERVPSTDEKSPVHGTRNPYEPLNEPKKESLYEEGFLRFFDIYPIKRRGNRDKAYKAYKNALKRATEEEIHGGLRNYIGSDEVARGFAKGAAAWLNDDRWSVAYGQAGSSSGGKSTYADSLENASRNATNFLREKENLRQEGG